MKSSAIASLVATAVIASTSVAAAESGFYVGLTIGESSTAVSKSELDRAMAEEFNLIESSLDDGDTAYGAVIGYRFLPYLAAELGWLDLGDVVDYRASLAVISISVSSLDVRARASSSGPMVSALGILPLGDAWEIFGRAGLLFSDNKLTVGVSDFYQSFSTSDSDRDEDAVVGIGAAVNFADHWAVRAEYTRIFDAGSEETTGEEDVDLIGLTVTYRF